MEQTFSDSINEELKLEDINLIHQETLECLTDFMKKLF